MNIVVIGLGSMGRGRIRLIKQYNDSFQIIGIDLSIDRRKIAKAEFGIETRESFEDVIKLYDLNCALICTSPLSHSKLINLCLKHNLHVFTELNLITDGYDENSQLSKERNRVLFLSSTFLHRVEIKKINKLVKEQDKKLNYTYHIGQYLPDWHPWESYKDFFVGDKKTNGCREIFAIELPWLIEVFGNIKDIVVRKNKISSLNIDYDDNYMVIFEHEAGHKGMVAVDLLSRKSVRNLEVFGENLYLSWDGSAEGFNMMDLENKIEENLHLYEKVDQLDQSSKFGIEYAYYHEIESFFDVIFKNIEPIYNFEKDRKILELIDRIEA